MITQEQLDGWRKLADRLSYYGAESDAADAITSLLDEVARLTAENERLSAIVGYIDAHAPRADNTCKEPGITLSEAARRTLAELDRAEFEGLDGGAA